jgi:hypothetical protein|tara:strand:+ start:118 stop:942 length:825 start_codon:yes stop_codon:yes gene_type:complete
MDEFLQLAKSLFPYLPDDVINKYVDYYAESDRNIDVALGKLRQDPIYDDYFPGNKRADKTVRYNEAEYLAVKESYKLSLEDFGLNPELFDDTFSNLIAGDVSPSEFKTRVGIVFEGIKSNIPQVKEFYSANYGIDLTDEAIFASAIKPELGEQILNKQIAVSQIGGEARRAGFGDTISLEKAQELQAAGITQAQARQLFQEAQLEVPRIQELQARGGRQVDDVFGVEDFTEAAVFRSPEELEEVRVLEAEEASRFTPMTGPARRGRRVQGLVQE